MPACGIVPSDGWSDPHRVHPRSWPSLVLLACCLTACAISEPWAPLSLPSRGSGKSIPLGNSQANTYWSIAARARQESGDIAEHAGKLATENMAAWRQIRDVADERAKAIRAAARPPDSVARQPYDPHKWRAELNAEHPGKVKSSTVPDPKRPNVGRRGHPHRKTGIPYDSRGFPIFDDVAMYDTRLARSLWHGQSRRAHMRAATRELRDAIRSGRIRASKFDAAQLKAIESGKAKIPGYAWHHHQHHGRMQLIPERYHQMSAHVGGDKLWRQGD